MTKEIAAKVIATWIERRFYKEFWSCKRCGWERFSLPVYQRYISNYGVCESCHFYEDSEQMDYEADAGPCTEFHFMRARRWVGPRFEMFGR